jgi:uncharacterized membrane protein (DUF485 family)
MKMSSKKEIMAGKDFLELSSQKRSISITLTVVELFVYFGFIYLIAFQKPFLSTKITPEITIGIPIGIGVILLSWVLTGIYVRWANSKYDSMVEKVKESMGA